MSLALSETRVTFAPIPAISPQDLRHAALDGGELAVVDVRDAAAYQSGHISIAVELPYGEIELRVADLLPRRSVRLVVTDDDGGELAQAAAGRLFALGYGDVRVLSGGLRAWTEAGNELITGEFSLSKALGEYVERRYHTPKITVDELQRKIAGGEPLVILDTRPLEEFAHISIPGGIAAPGAELLYRIFDQVPSPDTPVVINCAGRTRAIIGAQALRNAGFPNPGGSLENGTSAWLLAGFEPGRGAQQQAGRPSQAGLERARQAGDRVAADFAIRTIGAEELALFRAESDERTLYLFDVRTREEFEASHLPGARSAPGGQLVQTTDRFVGTRQGRIVLVDDADLVRARITASWLHQLGLDDVHVYPAQPSEHSEAGAATRTLLGDGADAATVSPAELKALLAKGEAVVIDLEPAPPYYRDRTYIPGSLVGRRPTLAATLPRLGAKGRVVLTSADGDLARLAAAEQAGRGVVALEGGTRGWADAGFDTATGRDQPAIDPAEALPRLPNLDERRVNLDAYVRWGDHITEQLERDGLVRFRGAQ